MDTRTKLKHIFLEWQESTLPEFQIRHKKIDLNTPHIVDIIGVRRCGKTYYMYQLISELLNSNIPGSNIIYINLDDDRLHPLNGDELPLLTETFNELYDVSVNHKIYLFLDEIQNIPDWERWTKSTYDKNKDIKIIISGSNASLLSGNISTLLTGRHITTRMFPFSFTELLDYHKIEFDLKTVQYSKVKILIKKLFNKYLKYGGFPESVLYPSIDNREMLQSYFEDIIYRDIITRFNIRNYHAFKQLSLFCISNISKPHTFNSLRKIFSNYTALSTDAVINYLSYLEDAFLLFTIPHYDYSIKKQINKPKKIYCVDTGMINAVSFRFSHNTGQIYENIVFIQLKRLNYEIYYWQNTKGHEVDFVIKKGLEVSQLIQVCYDISNIDTRSREINGLVFGLIHFNLPKGTIITSDYFHQEIIEGKDIRYVPLWYWLLEIESSLA